MSSLLRPLLLLAALFAFGCGKPVPPELGQAAAAIRYHSAPMQLSRSLFAAAFPDGTPSQYVGFLFSDMGAAEWPQAADAQEAEQMKAARRPFIPAGVAVVPLRPDPAKGMQLVVRGDDARGMVVMEGYADPAATPLLRQEWALPKVAAAAGVAELYRSNRELGMSDQAF